MVRSIIQKTSMNDSVESNLFFNREISLLDFNRRVLAQAEDKNVPILERLKFLCISSTNLDEFFEIRVAGLKQKSMVNFALSDPDGMTPQEILQKISDKAHALVSEQYRVLNELIFPQLSKESIRVLGKSQWNKEQTEWVEKFFRLDVLPVLSPLGLDPAHPFPRILNKSLNLIVCLEGQDAFGRDIAVAVVPAPRSLPRVVAFPKELSSSSQEFVSLASIIRANVAALFPDMMVTGCFQFRVTRNSNLFVDEEEIDDLLIALEGELPSRRYGDAVRLEVEDNCPEQVVRFLVNHFELELSDVYRVNGPVNLNRLLTIYDMVERNELKFPPFTPYLPRQLVSGADFFEQMRRADILLHHPFESFSPVIDFLRQAAHDPDVVVIKQTLYRTGSDTVIADYLVHAARSGKEVTAVIEIRAQFDEEANISLATRLQEAGVHVVYGVVGYKTHCKMLMVVRREGQGFKRYVHLGTGNYHTKTARLYTDYGLLTYDQKIGEDVHKLFMQLTGLGRAGKLKKLLQAPFTLHKSLMEKIEHEISLAKEGKLGRIMAKMNALTDPAIIKAFYEASQAGVEIDLIVRGMCCLKPGVPSLSDTIRVRSIVGRFLEHDRAYYFHNGGQPEVYLSSADCMTRNLSQRIEVAFPVEDERLKERIIKETFRNYLSDNTQAWNLEADGTYVLVADIQPPHAAQHFLVNHLREP